MFHLLNGRPVCFLSSSSFTNGHLSNTFTNSSRHRVWHSYIRPPLPLLHYQLIWLKVKSGHKQIQSSTTRTNMEKRGYIHDTYIVKIIRLFTTYINKRGKFKSKTLRYNPFKPNQPTQKMCLKHNVIWTSHINLNFTKICKTKTMHFFSD